MTREDPRAGLVAWIATVFGAFYVSLLAFVIRLGNTAPAIPEGAPFEPLGPERGWILTPTNEEAGTEGAILAAAGEGKNVERMSTLAFQVSNEIIARNFRYCCIDG
jgi:hypothetical protein